MIKSIERSPRSIIGKAVYFPVKSLSSLPLCTLALTRLTASLQMSSESIRRAQASWSEMSAGYFPMEESSRFASFISKQIAKLKTTQKEKTKKAPQKEEKEKEKEKEK